MQPGQRLARSAQLPTLLAGHRVERLDTIGVNRVGGKITREHAFQRPVALGEVLEEDLSSRDVPVLGGQQREPEAIRLDFLIAVEGALGKLTGADPGNSNRSWLRWWEKHGEQWKAATRADG